MRSRLAATTAINYNDQPRPHSTEEDDTVDQVSTRLGTHTHTHERSSAQSRAISLTGADKVSRLTMKDAAQMGPDLIKRLSLQRDDIPKRAHNFDSTFRSNNLQAKQSNSFKHRYLN